MLSSEDEGPCYIDSETPANWIKILSEQSSKNITNSRKDLLNDLGSSGDSDNETQVDKKDQTKKKKKKKPDPSKQQDKNDNAKKMPLKIPDNLKKVSLISINTYIPLTLYPCRGSRGITDIPPRRPFLLKLFRYE
jgi:hypothetical protein